MKRTEKGFTLLEAVLAILLFGFVLQMLMNFFFHMYGNGKIFQTQSYLMDNARTVNAFVKEKIRNAEEVRVTVKDAAGNEREFGPILSPTDRIEVSGELVRITFKESTEGYKGIEIKAAASNPNKGQYLLNYVTYDGPSDTIGKNAVLISDMVKSIEVSYKRNSEDVLFKCSYAPQIPKNRNSEVITDTFSESLIYKEKID